MSYYEYTHHATDLEFQVLKHLLYLMGFAKKGVQQRVALALAHLCPIDDCRTIFIDNNGKRFYAHRVCLVKSDVFRARFYGGYREMEAKDIVVPDIKWDVFELMKRIIGVRNCDHQQWRQQLGALKPVCWASPLSMATSRPLCENGPMRYHCMANHLSVLDHTGIGFTILLRLSLRPALASLKLVTAIPSQILLGIPQTRFRLFGSREWPSMGSNLCHEDSNISDSVPCIRYLKDIHSISSSCRTKVVVRHAFIGENGDERHIIITFIMFLGANEYLRIGISLN
ncbi:ARM REPEAT PROTEIN INTERACTING WITH [Arachis hypogaea]|uniref:ARM REPEAT PROTEIN INTERACTING WITH n=1 Tax=Arachis hypogaea TaxID=3818 RepID=A0A6B9V7H3_ARAHY|nr:ARM REPEAT PROTEIN INTERACTING WITH [Arachis hypogaea]